MVRKGIDVIITYNNRKEDADAVVVAIKKARRAAVALQLSPGVVKSFDTFSQQLITLLKENWNCNTFDFLINNAGIEYTAPIVMTTKEQFDIRRRNRFFVHGRCSVGKCTAHRSLGGYDVV